MAVVLGRNAILSIKEGGGSATGSFVEIPEVTNVTANIQTDQVEVTSRSTAGFKAYLAGLKDFELTFSHLWDTVSASQDVLRDAAFAEADTIIGFQLLDQTSGDVLAFDGVVTAWSREEPLDGAMTVNVTVKNRTAPTYTDTITASGT